MNTLLIEDDPQDVELIQIALTDSEIKTILLLMLIELERRWNNLSENILMRPF